MSSILRALKKLDEEALHHEDPAGERKIKMRQVIHRRSGTPRRTLRIFFISAVFVVLIAALLVIFNSNPDKPAVMKQPAVSYQKPLGEDTAHPGLKPQPETPAKKDRKKETAKEAAPHAVTPEQAQPAVERLLLDTGKRIPQKAKAQTEASEKPAGGFVLNGIIWSDNPAMRVALINGQYLKEGGSLNGVTVIEIKQKAVTLQRGQQKWTINLKK